MPNSVEFSQLLFRQKLILFDSKGLHNFMHPRTDPVVIMIAIDKSGEKILLGRGVFFPLPYLTDRAPLTCS